MSGQDPGFQMAAPAFSRPRLPFTSQDNEQQDSSKAGSGDALDCPSLVYGLWGPEAFCRSGGKC